MSPRGGAARLGTGGGTAFVLIAIVAAGYILAILLKQVGRAHPVSVDPGVVTGYMVGVGWPPALLLVTWQAPVQGAARWY
jgi:hypothetical protein